MIIYKLSSKVIYSLSLQSRKTRWWFRLDLRLKKLRGFHVFDMCLERNISGIEWQRRYGEWGHDVMVLVSHYIWPFFPNCTNWKKKKTGKRCFWLEKIAKSSTMDTSCLPYLLSLKWSCASKVLGNSGWQGLDMMDLNMHGIKDNHSAWTRRLLWILRDKTEIKRQGASTETFLERLKI